MPNCAIVNCKNSTKLVGCANGNVSFHRFPIDPYIKDKWIIATGNKNWFPTKHSTICSVHFDKASLAGTEKNRRLMKTAYPTIQILNTITNKEEPCTSNEMPPPVPLNTQKNRRLADELYLAKQKIKQQNLKITRLREQNRRKAQRILTLVTSLKCLKKKCLEQAQSLKNINLTTKEL